MEELVRRHGFEGRCSGVRAVNLGVAEADSDRDAALDAYGEAGRLAIEEDGAEVICLGCGPMLGLRERLESTLAAPVIEGVPAAIKIAESMLGLGLNTSKVRSFRGREEAGVP